MEAKVYNQKAKEVGSLTLPEALFSARWKSDLVHQVITSMQSNMRDPIAHAKDRGEVAGGGKKPWKQKGTGRARHGSTRSPIWVGGGVAHGPRKERNWQKRIPQSMKNAALVSILSRKWKDGEIVFLDEMIFSAPKTTEAKSVIKSISTIKGFEGMASKKNNALFVGVVTKSPLLTRSFSNIGNVVLDEIRNINPLSLLTYRYCVLVGSTEAIRILQERIEGKAPTTETSAPVVAKEASVRKSVVRKAPKAKAKA